MLADLAPRRSRNFNARPSLTFPTGRVMGKFLIGVALVGLALIIGFAVFVITL